MNHAIQAGCSKCRHRQPQSVDGEETHIPQTTSHQPIFLRILKQTGNGDKNKTQP